MDTVLTVQNGPNRPVHRHVMLQEPVIVQRDMKVRVSWVHRVLSSARVVMRRAGRRLTARV
jgi:hypothetical protein